MASPSIVLVVAAVVLSRVFLVVPGLLQDIGHGHHELGRDSLDHTILGILLITMGCFLEGVHCSKVRRRYLPTGLLNCQLAWHGTALARSNGWVRHGRL